MLISSRSREMDVSNRIDVTDPQAVCETVLEILSPHFGREALAPMDTLFADFARLYLGEYPGFHGCDVGYHNMQHVLDVTLAMARLMDGYQRVHQEDVPLTAELALVGIAGALFHDSGYIRRLGDTRYDNGAGYTRIHVTRSSQFVAEYLPTVGLEALVSTCQRVVHFTGYEVNPADIEVPSELERTLGWLLGTADLIAQMSDVAYLEKCRDKLYREFVDGGMAGDSDEHTQTGIIYRSPEHLMEATPNFIRSAIQVRLDGYFHSCYRYAAEHFGGVNLYMEGIEENCRRLEELLAKNDRGLLLGEALSPD